MKTLTHKQTPTGTNILTHIANAMTDRLETSAQALAHVQGLDGYKELIALYDEDKRLVAKLQAARRPLDGRERQSLLKRLNTLKIELEATQKDYEAEHPVYLIPANALLVDDIVADNIEADMKIGQFIELDIDEDGKGFGHSILMGEFIGKRYRMPGTKKWHVIEYPDEIIPADAILTEPAAAELEDMEAARMAALPPEARTREKAAHIKIAEDVFIRAHTLADTLSPAEADTSKRDAKTALTEAKTAIEARYKI